MSGILFAHLLQYPRKGLFSASRLDASGVDWDVVTCINDLRNYIYGGLPEDDLGAALSDRSKRLHLYRGALAFYPLIDDVAQLRSLDGWMMNALAAAIRCRATKLHHLGYTTYVPMTAANLSRAGWYEAAAIKSRSPGQQIDNDVRIPSFVRIWKYSRRALNSFNLSRFPFKPDS